MERESDRGPEPEPAAPTATSLSEALTELDRAQRDRWLVALVLLLAVVAVLSWVLLEPVQLEVLPAVVGAFILVTAVYGANVALQERRSRRMVRSLLAEQQRRAALTGRIATLEALDLATRRVTDAEELTEVVERILAAAQGLLVASGGMVLLRAGDRLTVAVSAGPDAPDRGYTVGPGHLATAVLLRGAAVRSAPDSAFDPWTEAREVAAPLRLGERIVGVLLLQRSPGSPRFTGAEAVVLERFGAHAARALRQTTHLDAERRRAVQLETSSEHRLTATADLAADLDPPLAVATGLLRALGDDPVRVIPGGRDDVISQVLDALGYVTALGAALTAAVGGDPHRLPPGTPIDLAEVVRAAGVHARGLALAQGEPRRVTVYAPGPALLALPALELNRLVLGMLAATIEGSPTGTDLALELRAVEGAWHLVLTHAGSVLATEDPRLATLHRTAAGLGGTLVTGELNGSAQVRARVPVPVAAPPPVSLAQLAVG